MKKSSLARIMLVLLFSLVVSACSFQKNVNVESIEIIEETVPESVLVGEFDEAGIQVLIKYEDGTTQVVDIDSNFLKDEYQEQINKAGEYEIEILLKDKSVKFEIKIVEAQSVHVVNAVEE